MHTPFSRTQIRPLSSALILVALTGLMMIYSIAKLDLGVFAYPGLPSPSGHSAQAPAPSQPEHLVPQPVPTPDNSVNQPAPTPADAAMTPQAPAPTPVLQPVPTPPGVH